MFLTTNILLACSFIVVPYGRATNMLREALSKTEFAFEFRIMEKAYTYFVKLYILIKLKSIHRRQAAY